MNDMHNFSQAKQNAINQMLDMNKKARQNAPTALKNSIGGSLTSISNDTILILGLLLILSQDCSDMWLFLALVYLLL